VAQRVGVATTPLPLAEPVAAASMVALEEAAVHMVGAAVIANTSLQIRRAEDFSSALLVL
jgi:hypothetical protein